VMHKGSIVESGSPGQIMNAPQHEYTKRLIGAMPGREWEATRLTQPSGV
jgi:peptide/nickel transport system ATP-binding protein